MLKLMIAEDSIIESSNYQKILTNEKHIQIIATTDDGEDVIKLYKELKPDLLLLDLGLPKINGLDIINQLSKIENKCNIIVITGSNELRLNLYNTKKVYKVITKPFFNENLISSINDFYNDNIKRVFPIQKLIDLLLKLNLNPYSNSCTYLIDIISLAYFNTYMLDNIKKIYDIIAVQNNCDSEKIKSSIRSSIRTANRFADSELMYSIFYITKYNYNQILSPKHFIYCIVNYLNTYNNPSA